MLVTEKERVGDKKTNELAPVCYILLVSLNKDSYLLLPTSSFSLTSKSRHHPPNTFTVILFCFTSYPWYFCFNYKRNGPYFVVFFSFLFSRFVTHGQHSLSLITCFHSWLIIRASTLFALTSCCSANRGHPRMLSHCSPRSLASVSVTRTEVALSLLGLGLGESRKIVFSGLRYVGSFTCSVRGRYNQPGHERRFQGPHCIATHHFTRRVFSGKHTTSKVITHRKAQTSPPLYVLGIFSNHLATRNSRN